MSFVVTLEDPILRQKAIPVEEITSSVIELIDDMLCLMDEMNGIGLAAPQIARSIRLLVVGEIDRQSPFVMINPVIRDSYGSCSFKEGCLSIPGVFVDIVRPKNVDVEYLDKNGKVVLKSLSGLCSRVVQHEVDHLDGKLMIDMIDPDRAAMIRESVRTNGKF